MRTLTTATTAGSVASRRNYLRTAEIINGRSAMLGFVAGAGKVLLTGQPVLDQVLDPGQDLGAVVTVAAVAAGTAASIADRLEMTEAPQPWTPDSEMLNGRVAMLGMLALALTV